MHLLNMTQSMPSPIDVFETLCIDHVPTEKAKLLLEALADLHTTMQAISVGCGVQDLSVPLGGKCGSNKKKESTSSGPWPTELQDCEDCGLHCSAEEARELCMKVEICIRYFRRCVLTDT